MFGAFAWDALGMYNVRSFGHYTLEAIGVNESTLTLTDVEDISTLSRGDEVTGFPDDKRYSSRLYYVTDVTDDQIALQDTETSYGYIRDKSEIILEYVENDEE